MKYLLNFGLLLLYILPGIVAISLYGWFFRNKPNEAIPLFEQYILKHKEDNI